MEYKQITTLAHELGHSLLQNLGHSHLGEGLSQNKLEELKADTLGALYFLRSNDNRSDKECELFLAVYLIDYIYSIQEYIHSQNKENPDNSSFWYAFPGLSILRTLFESQSIVFANGKISIKNAKSGLEAMAKLGESVFAQYKDESVEPNNVDEYVRTEEQRNANNNSIRKYLTLIK
jgi:hypothetical protein